MHYRLYFLRGFMLLCLFVLASFFTLKAQTLTLYTFPPPHPYHWHNPHALLISTLRNYYAKTGYQPRRILGHMVIELKKDSTVYLTGMVPDNVAGMRNAILKEKIGLGVLFQQVPGHLEEAGRVEAELNARINSSNAAFISFQITDTAYQYLLAYIDSFTHRGYNRLYNGLNDPRAGKGSGCTAFGMSFLELIGALVPNFREQWAVHIRIPEKLIGDTAAHKKISIRRILFSYRWAKTGQAYRELSLYEPWLIYNWVNEQWEQETSKPSNLYQPVKAGASRGLLINCRQNMPVLPMFKQ